ncbi:MAG: hypothetical protein AAGB00_01045 [Planctomycetota bacterium]
MINELPAGVPNNSRRASRAPIFVVIAAAALCGLLGVLYATSATPPATPRGPAAEPRSPEVRFERFLADLRNRLEGATGSFDTLSSDNTSYSGGYKVTSAEMIEPETRQGVYRAQVVVREQSNFTVVTLPSEDGDSPTNQLEDAKRDPTRFPLGEGEGEIDRLLSGRGLLGEARQQADAIDQNRPRPIAQPPVATRTHVEMYHFGLAYVEGRWRLKTAIEPDTFLAEAFRIALTRQ